MEIGSETRRLIIFCLSVILLYALGATDSTVLCSMFQRLRGPLLKSASRFGRRRMGGGGGHDHGAEEQAYFLGMKPGTPSQGFEVIYAVTMISCLAVIVGGSAMKQEDSFSTWAKREAVAREKVLENGGEIEFGKYYQGTKFVDGEGLQAAPVLEEE